MLDLRSVFAGKAVLLPIKVRSEKLAKKLFKVTEPKCIWSDGLVVKSLDPQSRGPVFKTTGWLQGRLSLLSFLGR